MDGSGPVWGEDVVDLGARAELKRALAVYAVPDARHGVGHFLLDFGLYAAAIAGVLFVEPLWAKIAFSIVAGLKMANLGTLGHEAAHGNLAGSRKVNDVLGVLSFMPCMYNYRLWNYDHHSLHHIHPNVNHKDSWVPLSKAQFDALPRPRQWLHRLYRSPFGLGLAPYYLIERWMPVRFIPSKALPAEYRASAWRHLVFLTLYAAVFIAALAAAPVYSSTGSVTAVVLGFVLPFYVWMTMYAFTVYIQHTHPDMPWFDAPLHRKAAPPQESLSTTFEFPHWVKHLMHNVYDHAAHHVNPRIPFHRLPEATRALNALAPQTVVAERFTFRRLHETLRTCKLYDFETHRWLDFDGRPTTGVLVSAQIRDLIRMHGPGTMFGVAA